MEKLFGDNQIIDILTHPSLEIGYLADEKAFDIFLEGCFRELSEIWDVFDHKEATSPAFWAKLPGVKEIQNITMKFRGMLIH